LWHVIQFFDLAILHCPVMMAPLSSRNRSETGGGGVFLAGCTSVGFTWPAKVAGGE
jgi:hypothetical protein